MIREAIDRILELRATENHKIHGRMYTSRELYPVKEPSPNSLVMHTLTGLIDYIGAGDFADDDEDDIVLALEEERLSPEDVENLPEKKPKYIFHVVGPGHVEVISPLEGEFAQRHCYAIASLNISEFPFGSYMPVEEFIIYLKTHFEAGENIKTLLQLVGNLEDAKTVGYKDDGMTQTVTAKIGLAKVEDVEVQPVWELAPYRTFLEVAQPETPFVLRIRKGAAGPECALFECGCGGWSLKAIENIKEWLKVMTGFKVNIIA